MRTADCRPRHARFIAQHILGSTKSLKVLNRQMTRIPPAEIKVISRSTCEGPPVTPIVLSECPRKLLMTTLDSMVLGCQPSPRGNGRLRPREVWTVPMVDYILTSTASATDDSIQSWASVLLGVSDRGQRHTFTPISGPLAICLRRIDLKSLRLDDPKIY